MTNKIAFFYAQGTSYAFNWFGITIPPSTAGGSLLVSGIPGYATVAGILGKTALWDCGPPSDPFPFLLDQNIFESKRVDYSASFFPPSASINHGVTKMIELIGKLPAGQKFAIGGYSQGAAVCSQVYKNGLLPGTTGPLESFRSRFIGAVCFGNPMRATNHRGAVGGTWSGAWDDPGSDLGGHGIFPLTGAPMTSNGTLNRLTFAEDKWIELIGVDDVFACVGETTTGQLAVQAATDIMNLGRGGILSFLQSAIPKAEALGAGLQIGAIDNFFVDAIGKTFKVGGNGHTHCGFLPPPNSDGSYNETTVTVNGVAHRKAEAPTMYQVGLDYLTTLAKEYSVAPILLPTQPTTPANAGWSTTLVPPAS